MTDSPADFRRDGRGDGHQGRGGLPPMWCRRLLAGVLPILLLTALACSKTEDKAAEKRVFGDPPQFKAEPKVTYETAPAIVPCDVTAGALAWADNEFGDVFRLEPEPITVSMVYTEVRITAQVDDPQGPGDILGVFARYVPKYSDQESVVVLLDDGPHDCSMTSGDPPRPPTGCFGSPASGAVAVLQTCTTERICKPRLECVYDPAHGACLKEKTCIDGICHIAQQCDPITYRCLCGGPCDDLGTWAECTAVERMDLGGACTGARLKCLQGEEGMKFEVDPTGYSICDNRFESEPDQTSCKVEPQHCEDIVDCAVVPTCEVTSQYVTTADENAGDGLYTRKFAVANLKTPGGGAGLAQDCVVSQVHQTPILLQTADTLDFSLEVVDRSANDTVWPKTFPVRPNPATFACTGDRCMCCVLEKGLDGAPYTPGKGGGGCFGAPGLIGIRFPQGFCNDCLGNNDPVACCVLCSIDTGQTTCDMNITNPECQHPE
jgi:hypothetical protein